MAQGRGVTSGFLTWTWRGWLASRRQALKSPRWQAKEMRLGPESYGGIVSKQMTCLDFIFIKITLGPLCGKCIRVWQNWTMGDTIRLMTTTVTITAASIQCGSDSGGDDAESLRAPEGVRKDAVSYLKNKVSLFEEVFIYFALYCCVGIANPKPPELSCSLITL